jgi:hypothetical protein
VFFVPSWWVGNFVQADWTRKMFMLRSELWEQCGERWDRVSGYLHNDSDVLAWCSSIPQEAQNWPWPPEHENKRESDVLR